MLVSELRLRFDALVHAECDWFGCAEPRDWKSRMVSFATLRMVVMPRAESISWSRALCSSPRKSPGSISTGPCE